MLYPVLSLKNASLSFSEKLLFENIDLQIYSQDKICLIGKNGCGKSSLLKVLASLYQIDCGEFYLEPGLKVGYLSQDFDFKTTETIYQHITKDLKDEEKYLADIIIENLSLKKDKMMKNLSGGNLRKVSLARILCNKPDILLLDEPTNHLDISSIEWLENYLKNYNGGFICISHDRSFLKNISEKTFWLDRGNLRINNKGYDDFENFSEKIILQEEEALRKLNRKLEEENLWLQQGVSARRKRNQQRLQNLYQLREKLKNDQNMINESSKTIKFSEFKETKSSSLVLEIDKISHYFEDVEPVKKTLTNFSLRVKKGEKIALVGKNGSGKTTLIRLIMKELEPKSGTIKIGSNITISYADQKRKVININDNLWQFLCPGGSDTVTVSSKPMHVVTYLKNFLFSAQQIKSPISNLSGGELNRLLLAKILSNPGNFLILDEPTNDLDMDSLDVLEEILYNYTGTIIIVSHDRDFLERIVTRTIVFEENGDICDFIGGYSEYKKLKSDLKKNIKKQDQTFTKIDKKLDHSNNLSYKFKRELEILPNEIDKLEKKVKELEVKLNNSDLYNQQPEKFIQYSKELAENKQKIEELELRWLELEDMKEDNSKKY